MYKPAQFRIGNNPGWYGIHYTDQDIHQLMKNAGNLATRYFITLPQWEQNGMQTFTQRIKDVYEMGFRYNLYTFTNQFNTDYVNRATTMYPAGPSDPPGTMVRTMIPVGIYEPIFLSNGNINPDNKWAVYVEAGMKEHGPKTRLKGKGFPVYKKEGEHGDLFVTFEIQIPTELTKQQKELFKQLAELSKS